LIAEVLAARDVSVEYIRTFQHDPVPRAMNRPDGLVVMGGPIGVSDQDRYPFLKEALRLFEQTLQADKPVLGICLGSQLLATALGAPVTRG